MIVALLLALGSQPAHAANAPADSDAVHGYSYDIPTVVPTVAFERGPPANLATCTSAPAVGLGSYGHFARPDGGIPAVIYTYDCTACRAQAGDSWSTGAEVASGSSGELSTLRLAGVAAKGAAELPEGYRSFSAAKRAMGSPGEGNVFDHVVEQSQIKRGRFGAEEIHNPFNMNPVSARTNQIKANYYSRNEDFAGGTTVRNWLTPQSYTSQYNFGMRTLASIESGAIK